MRNLLLNKPKSKPISNCPVRSHFKSGLGILFGKNPDTSWFPKIQLLVPKVANDSYTPISVLPVKP